MITSARRYFLPVVIALFVLAACTTAPAEPTAVPTSPPTQVPPTLLPTEPPSTEEPTAQPSEAVTEEVDDGRKLIRIKSTDELQAMFNEDQGLTRLILIVSPICRSCITGLNWLQKAILERFPSAPLRVYVVWYPTDPGPIPEENAIDDPRVVNIWDQGRFVSRLFASNVDLEGTLRSSLPRTHGNLKWGQFVWDVFYLYDADAVWEDRVPSSLQSAGYPIILHREELQSVVANESPPVVIVPDTEETRYVIIPTESVVSYGVKEEFLGLSSNYAIGVTSQVDGEILVNTSNPALSEVGVITIDISTFSSDNLRRDERIQEQSLQSAKFPLAIFTPTELIGLPTTYTEGDVITFDVLGDLQVRESVVQTTFTISLKLEGGRLLGIATTQVLMTDFGFEPPKIATILQAENEVNITLEFVAEPVTS